MQPDQLETLYFDDDGHMPNNAALPLLRYCGVLPPDQRSADQVKALFANNQWGGAWVGGVFSYHHYHSTAHEAMGIVSGAATIQFGGKQGNLVQVQAGDVVVIPAGVGHCKQGSSDDFRVVGVYPHGQDWDLCTGEPEERPQVLENIRQVSLPQTDPVYGNQGPLLDTWNTQS